MIPIWWTSRVVHYELLLTGQIVTEDRYSPQMEHMQQARKLKESVLGNRKGIQFIQDNGRLQVATDTIRGVGWETVYHPPYRLDFAPFNYHIFHSLDNKHRGKSFANEANGAGTNRFFCIQDIKFLPPGHCSIGGTLAKGSRYRCALTCGLTVSHICWKPLLLISKKRQRLFRLLTWTDRDR